MSNDEGKRGDSKGRRAVETVCPNCNTDIMHWVHFAAAGDIPVFEKREYPVDKKINKKIFIYDGSVTDLECEAVVISANKKISMQEQGLVAKLAGEGIIKEAKTESKKHGPCEDADVIETGGYDLPAEHVLHVVIPTTFKAKEAQFILRSCYVNCLDHLREKGYKSIAFPALGSQTLRISKKAAAEVALGSIRAWLEDREKKNDVDIIILCRFENEDKDVYDKYLHKYFPVLK
ncbi:ADP-ribose glycohydrolase MACROD1-like [Bolinopsis microptera]|uniref:ADP-ribose glycohydrolase MACROD1-like n=1 Tax=Bolinopsis microptera TaxID=2820187 RepID=UPI0030790A72